MFAGRIALSGTLKGFDGNGTPDAVRITNCNTGPRGNPENNLVVLKAEDKGNVTLAWKVAEDYTLIKSASYSFREATIQFDKSSYDLDDQVTVILNDLDIKRPNGFQKPWIVRVWSDSDLAGIELKTYFAKNPAVSYQLDCTHKGDFQLTSSKESRDDGRLFARPGDSLYVELVPKL